MIPRLADRVARAASEPGPGGVDGIQRLTEGSETPGYVPSGSVNA